MPKRIPISAAKRIADEYGFDQVVIFARKVDTEPGLGDGGEHVTTYGKTVADCDVAARMGNHLKRVVGWPEAKCRAVPARLRAGVAKESRETVDRAPCQQCGDPNAEEVTNPVDLGYPKPTLCAAHKAEWLEGMRTP